MRNSFLYIFLFFISHTIFSQTLIGDRVVWEPYSADPRISFTFKTGGIIAGGVETPELTFENNTSHKLNIKVSYKITDNCGASREYSKSEGLKPNSTSYSKGGFNTGIDFSSDNCKSIQKYSDNVKTKIKDVSVYIISIDDITEKEETQQRIKDEKDEKERIERENARAAQENARILAENKAKENVTAQSYYSNQSSNTTTATNQPTWQETNARILAENQRIYAEQRERIAETERINQENSEKFVEGAAEVINLFGTIINDAREEREKKEAKIEAQRLKELRIKEEAERKRTLRLELRKSFFNQFSDGEVPLSSKNIPVSELYFFVYSFDQNTIEQDLPVAILSNVFIVSKYNDGTWPFKSFLINDIKKTGCSGVIMLIGYFTSQELADTMRSDFIKYARASEIGITNIFYKGKQTKASNSTYFWNEEKTETPNPAGKATFIPAKGDEDFWETGQKRKKMAEEKKKEEENKKKSDSKNKSDDFWEN